VAPRFFPTSIGNLPDYNPDGSWLQSGFYVATACGFIFLRRFVIGGETESGWQGATSADAAEGRCGRAGT